MKKISLIAFVCFYSLITSAKDVYFLDLKNVQKNKEIISSTTFKQVEDLGIISSLYQDDIMKLEFTLQPICIDLNLKNESHEDILVDWNKMIYVDNKGNAERIIHKNISFKDKDKEMEPSLIIGQSKISDSIIPISKISYSSYFRRWMYGFLILDKEYNENDKLILRVPIKVGEEQYQYTFTFEVCKYEWKMKTVDGARPTLKPLKKARK